MRSSYADGCDRTAMESQMATAEYKAMPRRKLSARPQADLDMKAARQEITERYKKTLEYLGR